MKTCCRCKHSLDAACFGASNKSSDGLRGECKECRKSENPSARLRSKEVYSKHRDTLLPKMAEYYRANREAKKQYGRLHYQRNKYKYLANATSRKSHVAQATPGWVDDEELFMISEAYDLARLRTEVTGIVWAVDHFYPIRGKSVCGLHTILNLRVIPDKENNMKRAKHPDDFYARKQGK
jgi:hypothetical protein